MKRRDAYRIILRAYRRVIRIRENVWKQTKLPWNAERQNDNIMIPTASVCYYWEFHMQCDHRQSIRDERFEV